jgi:hypothetical protein
MRPAFARCGSVGLDHRSVCPMLEEVYRSNGFAGGKLIRGIRGYVSGL